MCLHYGQTLIIVLAALALSCRSRPAVQVETVKESFFADALQLIKENSPLVVKRFEPREVILSGSGYKRIADIAVKSDFQLHGNNYQVSYDFANAVQAGENTYKIPFHAEDKENGLSRNDVLFWSPGEEEAGLLLSFDDTFWHTWRQYFDLFDAYGARVTFFVQGNLEPDVPDDGLRDFCIETAGRGCGLGFHTVNHPDLRKVAQEIFESETFEAAQAFAGKGIFFSAFAYPFGFSEPWMRETLVRVFPVTKGYGTNIRFCDTLADYKGYIVSKAIDNIIYPEDGTFESDMLLIMAAAKFTGRCVVPFTTHDISDEAEWGIKPARLEYLLRTAQRLKLKFHTYGDFPALFPAY
ncbi:MAG: polysaccharide deacetylase family protein [Treponema sp.]|nr:polysaccharide deacetylase family protein [Treponema sp.]